jgi:hypothetical protein
MAASGLSQKAVNEFWTEGALVSASLSQYTLTSSDRWTSWTIGFLPHPGKTFWAYFGWPPVSDLNVIPAGNSIWLSWQSQVLPYIMGKYGILQDIIIV